ncbi:hypothetical protein J5Y17_09270 [Celeribacter sp. PS-C1]|nr:hypothetical protein [Celeribacter sp. PS-C1]
MSKYAFLTLSAVTLSATNAMAQSAPALDCALPANVGSPACLNLPPVGDVQNFVPVIAPALAAAGVAALAGGGSSTSTTSTTATTSTTN